MSTITVRMTARCGAWSAAALVFSVSAASAAPANSVLLGAESQPANRFVERVLAVGTCGGKTCYVKSGGGVFGSIRFVCRPNPPCPRNCPKSGCSAS